MNKQLSLKVYVLIFCVALIGGGVGAGVGVRLLADAKSEIVSELEPKQVFVEESMTIDAISKVNPSVVSIIASKQLAAMRQPTSLFDLFAPEFGLGLPEMDDSASQDAPKQKVGGGTGFVISQDGLVLTNKHVIDDSRAEYSVVMADGTEFFAKVLSKDPLNDIAFVQLYEDEDLSVKPSELPTVKLGNSDLLPVGSKVIAIGNALSEFDNTTTSGIISGLGRSITAGSGSGASSKLSNLLQTDASINPGNSGGPLVNLNGEVIGINTAIAQSANGIGFAIPINEAKSVVETVIEHGKIIRPMLGVRYVEITPAIARQLDLGVDYGVFLQDDISSGYRSVVKDGPADKAGLKSGDIILEVEGSKIDAETSLQKEIAKFKPGQEIDVTILRDAQEITILVELGEFIVE